MVLMMRYGKVVPSLHIKVDKSNLNPAIRLNEYNLDIPVAVRDWERNEDGDRIACVSSYGFGGSNGHAIQIQKLTFDCEQEKVEEAATKSCCYVALSSTSSEGLEQTLDRFKKQIMHRAEINLESISYTSTCHRDHFPYRICFAVNSVKELAEQVATKLPEQKRQTLPLNLVFVYCGVGTTWTGMCSQLIKIDEGFRAGILEVDKYLKPLSGISMENLFSQSTTDYGDPFVNHIAIFTTQVGLTFMWRKLGIKPNVVVGQSVGEVAAAYASESIDLRTAVDLIYHRSKILASHQGGSMMVVKGVHIEVVEKYCERYEKRVSVAVYSSPIACTLSGETVEMKKLKTDILEYSKRQNTNIFIKELDVRCAYHSHMVEQCMHEIRQNLKPAVKIPRTIPVISTVTGRQAEADDLQSVDYWAQNIRKPVLMNEAIMNSLKEKQNNIILEIGPKPVLRAHIEDIVQAGTVECLSSMTYSKELSTRSASVVNLYENGVDIEWKNEVRMSRLCSLPAYAFDRRTLLLIPEEEKRKHQGLQVASVVDHMFLRNSLTQGKEFYIVIGKATTPFVFDHFMGGTLLVPGSTYLDAVFAIAARKLRLALVDISVSVELEHMHTPLAERDDQIECEVNVARDEVTVTFAKGNRIFSIGKARKGDFLLPKTVPVSQLIDSYNNVFLKADVYTALEDLGFKHGSSLRIIERVWYSNTDCLAEIHVTDNVVEEFNSTHIHPAVVDSMFQVCGVFARGTDSGDDIIVPKGVRATRVHGYLQQRMFCFAAKSRTAGRQIYYNVILLDEAGGVICEIDDFYTQTVFSKMEENVSNAYSLNWCEEKPIQLTEITPFSKFDILMFGTEETFRLVRHIFEHINVDFVTLSFTLPDTQMDEHKVLEHIKKKRYHAVVYAHLSVTSLTENHNDLIYQISKWNFLWLKDLMCILSRSSLREPLFVMTNNTQQKEENNGNTLNLCGAELWGMTRCAQQESLYPDIRLLDIDVSSCDRQTLLTIIGNSLPSEKELKMEGKSVWKSRLRQVTESHELKSQKVLPFEEGILAKLKTAHPNKIVSPFLELVEYDVKNVHLSQDSVRIRLYQSCLYDTAVFPVTSCSFNQKYLLWPRTSAEGFTPLSIEGEGLLVQEGTSIAKVPNGDRLYFCYPVNMATYVDIPSQCIFMPSEIPSYMPGLLTLSVVLFSSVSRVPKGISSTVLVHESFQCCQSFVEGFLECCCDRPVSCLYTTDIVKGTLQHEKMFNGIIVLTKLNEEITEKLLACVPTLQYIITLPVFLPLNLRHMIAMATQEITVIELRGEELFRSKHLMKIMPMIRSSLGKCHGKALCTEDLKRDGSVRVENLALPSKTCPLSDNICELTPIYASAKHMFRKNSCYIVVGGLTGLGWILVTYIAENGGGHIASLSRRKPSNQQLNEMDILMNKTRCKVKAYQSDITDFHNLNNTIKCLQNDLNGIQIKGIFNGAGVLDNELLVRMTEQQVEKVFKPKVLGSLNLHLATEHLTLDFFVMQSSIVSIIGNVGQSNYGAANSFMDALVHHRRSQNLSGQTINWGPLSVGMAQQNTEIKIHLQKMGMSPLTAEDICSLFKETLTADRRQTLLGSINWSILEKQLGSAKFKDLVPLQVNSPQNEDEQGHVFDETSFQMLTEDQKDSVLFEHIVQVLCSVLPIRDTTTLVPNLQIGELGIDSFAAMSSVNKLVDLTGCRVPLQIIMSDTATVYDIVLFIRASMDKKVHSNGDVGSNDHFLETDTKLSFMEKETLLEYASSKNKENFVTAVDIATETTELGLETWRKILRHVVLMNPELCRRFVLTSDGIAVHDVSDDDADVKVKLVTVEDMVNIDPRNRLRFSLENELPIQFQIAFDRLCTYIRVILHAGSQDLITQTIIARDIKIIASSVI